LNVRDFNIEIPRGDKLEIIFSHQHTLLERYHTIEVTNMGRPLPDPNNIDLDNTQDQLRLKEFAWRITEELAEATECLIEDMEPEGDIQVHFLEELVDALHFSVEFDLMSKLLPREFLSHVPAYQHCQDTLDYLYKSQLSHFNGDIFIPARFRMYTWLCVEQLGKAMNTLKNKPWKSTHMNTDRAEYRKLVVDFNLHLFRLMWMAGFTPLSLTQMYLNKNAVNLFRIRSNY